MRMTLVYCFVAACAPTVTQLPPALDPSNPNAPESHVSSPITSGPAADSSMAMQAATPEAMAMDTASSQQAEDFTCPMHPEVSSPKPGTCPKCGMNLEKRKNASPVKGHDHQHMKPDAQPMKMGPGTKMDPNMDMGGK